MDVITLGLFILIVADITFGVVTAVVNKNFNSNAFKKGLATHSLIFFGLLFATIEAKDLSAYAETVKVFKLGFIVMYASSIIENYIAIGGQLPDSVKQIFTKKKDDE